MVSAKCVSVLLRLGFEIEKLDDLSTVLRKGEVYVTVPRGLMLDARDIDTLCATARVPRRVFEEAAIKLAAR